MKLRDLDLEWLTVVTVGIFSHVNNTCIVGFCGDPAIASFQVDLPFILFILSVLTFVADHNWYPTSLKKPHSSILLILNVLTALTISNVALKVIWLPLQSILTSASIWISNWVYEQNLHQDGSRSNSGQSAWRVYLSNILEQHGAHAVPTPMLHFAPEESDVGSALLQWRDDTLPYAVSVLLSVVMLGTRFLAPGVWDRLRLLCLSAQGSLRRRRGRILLLPGGSLARLRSLAPRYVLSKVDDSDDEADGRSVDSPDYSSVGACSPPAPPAHQETHQRRQSFPHQHPHPPAHAPAPPPPPPPPPAPAVPMLPLTISKTAGAYGVPTISSVSTVVL